jgi:hypothetical protein
MPLSEREQRILEEIEKGLYQEDPGFARRGKPRLPETRRARLGIAIFIAGFALLIAFFVTSRVVVGVAAFGAMVGGIVLFSGAMKGLAAARRRGDSQPGERLFRVFRGWEERMRRRRKGS